MFFGTFWEHHTYHYICHILIIKHLNTILCYSVEKVKTEYRDVMRMDSVYIRDSVTVTAKGDTVIRDRWRTEYRDRWRRDTITRTDTVPMPIPVERKLSRWEQAKMDYGGHALTTVAVTILIVVGQTVYKLKKG